MSLATNYTTIKNQMVVVNFNRQVQGVDANGNPQTQYQPAVIECRMDACTPDGACHGIVESLNVGTASATQKTIQEIYTQLNTMNPSIAALYKAACISAINVDPSV